ncbi:PcfB family protein [Christensenella minuta]|jgi:mRNA degradation ribonuclease J1/J2|uniref:PcfB family protein n=1 Tax=Christensenella minuta TaxID=626937 RepID=UPI0021572615|nr:PcfB family protein [Christensenella minuta]
MPHESDAAEQVVRIMLSGGEVALRLTGSLVKNVAAFLLAMRQNNKVVYGRKSIKKLLQNTRDLRVFPMSKEQFQQFEKLARPRKILYAGVGDKQRKSNVVDLMLPITEIERANVVFETIGFKPEKDAEAPEQEQDTSKKKEPQSPSNSKNSKDRSTSQTKNSKTSERPSVTAKLEAFDQALKQQAAKPKTRAKGKGR